MIWKVPFLFFYGRITFNIYLQVLLCNAELERQSRPFQLQSKKFLVFWTLSLKLRFCFLRNNNNIINSINVALMKTRTYICCCCYYVAWNSHSNFEGARSQAEGNRRWTFQWLGKLLDSSWGGATEVCSGLIGIIIYISNNLDYQSLSWVYFL